MVASMMSDGCFQVVKSLRNGRIWSRNGIEKKKKKKMKKMHDCYEVWTDGSAVLRTDTKRRKFTGGAAYVILHRRQGI